MRLSWCSTAVRLEWDRHQRHGLDGHHTIYIRGENGFPHWVQYRDWEWVLQWSDSLSLSNSFCQVLRSYINYIHHHISVGSCAICSVDCTICSTIVQYTCHIMILRQVVGNYGLLRVNMMCLSWCTYTQQVCDVREAHDTASNELPHHTLVVQRSA